MLKSHVKLCFVYIFWEGTRERPRGSCRQVFDRQNKQILHPR